MEWEKVKLGDICRIEIGRTPSRSNSAYFGRGYTWLSIADMNGQVYIERSKEQITQKAIEETQIKLVPRDTVLFSFKLSIGKVNITKIPLYTNEAIAALIIKNQSRLNTKFLYYVMGHYNYSHLGERAVKGITLNKEKLNRLEIPISDLPTQQRIASILDEADSLRKADAQLLEKYDQLLQSTYLEMFEYSKKKNTKWELVSIESLAEDRKGSIRTGPFGSDLLHSEFVDEGIAVLGIDNAVNNRFEWGQRRFITKKKYDSLSRYTVFPGDIIITIMGTPGRCAVIPEDIPLAINTKHLAAITLDKEKANPYFISYSLHSSPFIQSQLKAKTRGAIMAGLNLSLIKELKMYLPPIELQNHFTAIASNIEQQRVFVLQQQQKSEALFQSLLQRAFRGELC